MIGVIGLGLVGGSMAKALNQNTDHTVYGYDINETISQKAACFCIPFERLRILLFSLCSKARRSFS